MKKALLITFALAIAVATVPMFAAFEAHVINVTAHIENAIRAHTSELAFGTVFPQEYLEKTFDLSLSTSFELQDPVRVNSVSYVIKQKPKCINDAGEHAAVNYWNDECPDGFEPMLDLCQFLSKNDGDPNDGNDSGHPSYYVEGDPDTCLVVDQPETITSSVLNYSATGWGGWSCPANTHAVAGRVIENSFPMGDEGIAEPGATIGGFTYPNFPHYTYGTGETGYVAVNGGTSQSVRIEVDCLANGAVSNPDAIGTLILGPDSSDSWIVDLKVPPVDGFVAQDWPEGCPVLAADSQDYGCDLWIEVTDIENVQF